MENVTYLRGLGSRFVTVCDRGGVKCVKSSVCTRYGQPLISKDYNYTNSLQYINVQQILVVTFEFTGAASGFVIMSCAARGIFRPLPFCKVIHFLRLLPPLEREVGLLYARQ